MSYRETPEVTELRRVADFDHPFRVTDAGTVADDVTGVYAPEVWHVEGPGEVDIHGAGWVPWSAGYSGQDRYRGPVMHASEFLGGGMATDLLAEPGVYVVTVVDVVPVDPFPHEWSPSGARCTRTGCNVAGTGDPDDGPCEVHPDYSPEVAAEFDPYPEPAGWIVLRRVDVDGPESSPAP